VVNAVVDAVRHFGVSDIQMPCTPMRVWQAIRTGQSDAGGLGSEAGGGLGSIDTSGGTQ
jgi:carbon-monoxide dehydrogenase large subunit